MLSEYIIRLVDRVKEHQSEFAKVNGLPERIKSADLLKFSFENLAREVEDHGLSKPRNRRGEHKKVLQKIQKTIRSLNAYIEHGKTKSEDLTALVVLIPSSELLEDLRVLWYYTP